MEKESILWLPDYRSFPERNVPYGNEGFIMCTKGHKTKSSLFQENE